MTRVVYIVGEEKITSYAKAKARANETGLTMKTTYEPIIEQCAVDPNLVARRMKAIREKAQQRKSHQALFFVAPRMTLARRNLHYTTPWEICQVKSCTKIWV